MRLLPSFSGFLYVWPCQTLLSMRYMFVRLYAMLSACICYPARVWMGFGHILLSCLTKLAHKGGKQWLRPAGVTQTMQAVCTDGHFDTKKAQETKTQGGGPDSTMLPHREAALLRPGGTWTAARRDSGQRARHNPVLHTSATSRQMHWNVWNSHFRRIQL